MDHWSDGNWVHGLRVNADPAEWALPTYSASDDTESQLQPPCLPVVHELEISLGLDELTDDVSALVDGNMSSWTEAPALLGLDHSEASPHMWISELSMGPRVGSEPQQVDAWRVMDTSGATGEVRRPGSG